MTIKAGMENYEQGKVEEDQKNHKGITVVFPSENHRFELNEMALEELLLQTNVKDRNVVVISVAGVFRKGKSFILDFFLRYMKAKYASKTVSPDDSTWLGPPNEPLKGFPWRGGSDRDTTGMLMWSEIFLATLPNKEEVAIIFLDTQGTFDSESTVKDCATIFALSTMISSIQIYNLSQNIQEDDLQHLQLFTEYGKLALADSGKKPFQKLQFLIRDWSFPYEAEYGEYGGLKILNKRLRISQKQHPELQSIRKHIKSCFSDISCFLMPHPGLKVATNPNFDGRLEDIESDFKECLKHFVPLLLAPEKLLLKQINGHKVKAKELVQYFKTYIAVFSADELPEPKTILIATAEANNLTAVADAKEEYRLKMENVCGGTKPYLNTAVLENEHLNIKSYVLEEFSKKRKMGGEEFSEIYKNNLDSDIEDMYKNFKHHNEAKNIFKAARTPAVFFILAFVHYLLSGIFGFIGLYSLANVANLVMGISIVVLCSWLWIRYSGEMVAVGEQIDEVASLIWENIMKPAYDFCIVKGMQSAVGQSPSFISTPTVDKSKQL